MQSAEFQGSNRRSFISASTSSGEQPSMPALSPNAEAEKAKMPPVRYTLPDAGHATANAILAVGLVLIVLLAPLPVGSNRGAAWALWAMLLGIGAAVYFLALALADSARSFRAEPLRHWFWLGGATLLYALVQALPIAQAFPAWAQALPDAVTPKPGSLSLSPSATSLAVLRGASMALFLLLMIEASARLSRALSIGWVLFSGVAFFALWSLALLFAFGDKFFWGEKTSALGSATGPFVNQNSFALFLGLGAVLGLALVLERARLPRMRHPAGRRRISGDSMMTLLLWSMLGVVVVALIATRSHIGIAAASAGLGLVWAITPRGSATDVAAMHRRIGAGVTVAALVAVLAMLLGAIPAGMTAQGADAKILGQGEFAAQVWQMVFARPLTGYGLDAFPVAFELFHRAPVSPEHLWDKAPSVYLGLWVELGVVFGTLPLIAAAGFLLRLVRVQQARRHDVALVVAALAALLVVAVHSLVDFGIEIQANQFLLLAVVALGLARRIVPDRPGGSR